MYHTAAACFLHVHESIMNSKANQSLELSALMLIESIVCIVLTVDDNDGGTFHRLNFSLIIKSELSSTL